MSEWQKLFSGMTVTYEWKKHPVANKLTSSNRQILKLSFKKLSNVSRMSRVAKNTGLERRNWVFLVNQDLSSPFLSYNFSLFFKK